MTDPRPTTEITLPQSKTRIVLYNFLVHGDYTKIKLKTASYVQFHIETDPTLTPEEQEKQRAEQIHAILVDRGAELQMFLTEYTTRLLIKDIYDGEKKLTEADIDQFVYNLSVDDGNFLELEAQKLGETSELTDEQKKN